jgi:hypothetical protein
MSLPQQGEWVKVLPPFAESFPGVYVVDSVTQHEDGQMAFDLRDTLDNAIGAFSAMYLEVQP